MAFIEKMNTFLKQKGCAPFDSVPQVTDFPVVDFDLQGAFDVKNISNPYCSAYRNTQSVRDLFDNGNSEFSEESDGMYHRNRSYAYRENDQRISSADCREEYI